MKFSTKDFFSKCDQISSFLRIWSDLLKKSLMENFIFCAVIYTGVFAADRISPRVWKLSTGYLCKLQKPYITRNHVPIGLAIFMY